MTTYKFYIFPLQHNVVLAAQLWSQIAYVQIPANCVIFSINLSMIHSPQL